MKSTVSRFSALNRRAEYLKLKTEKEKEKKQEENEEEELEEEEDDEDDKNKQNIQKPKNIPITRTPISPKTSLNRLEKQKLSSTSTTSQIPYNFSRSRMNYTSTNNNNNIDLNNKNQKDLLLMRQGLKDKNFQITGTKSSSNIVNKPGQNTTYSIKPSINSPKNIKSASIMQNNPSQILKATNSQSNLNSQKILISGNKYSSLRRFGDTLNKESENKNEIKIINKNNNYTINVTNNNNTFNVNNNNLPNNNNNFININENQEDIKYDLETKEKIEEKETNKESNIKSFSKKEPRKDIKEQNFIFNSNKIEKKEEKK